MLLMHLHSFRLPEWVTNEKVSWCVGIPVKDLGSIFLNGSCLHVVRFAFWFCRKKKQLISINSFYMQHWTLYKIWRGPLMLRMLILKFPFVLQNSLILLIFYPCSCISIAFILTVLFSWLFVRFLKSVDRFNDLIVSVYVTAGHILSSVV